MSHICVFSVKTRAASNSILLKLLKTTCSIRVIALCNLLSSKNTLNSMTLLLKLKKLLNTKKLSSQALSMKRKLKLFKIREQVMLKMMAKNGKVISTAVKIQKTKM